MNMTWIYDGEAWAYGFLPLVLSLALIAWSIRIAAKAKTLGHLMLSVLIVVLSGFAASILAQTLFFNGWPTYVPHILIGICLWLVIAQHCLHTPPPPRT